MAAEFGIRPWELDLLTFAEVDVFVRWLNDKADAQRKANQKAR